MHNAIKNTACILRKKKHFFLLQFFCPPGTLLGWSELQGEKYEVTIFTVVTNFKITVLEVLKLQKTIPRKANYLPHFAEA